MNRTYTLLISLGLSCLGICTPSCASLTTPETLQMVLQERLTTYNAQLPAITHPAAQLACTSLDYAAAVAQQGDSPDTSYLTQQLISVHTTVVDAALSEIHENKQPLPQFFSSLLQAVPQSLSTTQQQLALLFQLKQQLNDMTMSCIERSNLPLYQSTDDTHMKKITPKDLHAHLNAGQTLTPVIISIDGTEAIAVHPHLIAKLLPAPQRSLQNMVLSGIITSSTMYLLKLFVFPHIAAAFSTKK